MTELPIDAVIPTLLTALQQHTFLVLEAAPGAGKTTRVPLALHRANLGLGREVVVTEPRRLAARLAAHHVAKSLGEEVGGLVGYSVRYEDKSSTRTRIRYVTEGVLRENLRSDSKLEKLGVVVLDEFHERHVESDQLLTWFKQLAQSRTDLKVIVMSATLDGEHISRFLNDCPRLVVEGKRFPLSIDYTTELEDRPLEKRISLAVKSALREETEGNVLAFLPGAREIAAAARLLQPALGETIDVLPLHGELPLADQVRAVEPGRRRKVVLATNVAESSVTIDNVRAVVDTGLARVASFSPWTGKRTLEVTEVSQASATQRAGRAGRTAPGRVYRLYSEANFKARPSATLPEIQRSDLSSLVLFVLGLGVEPRQLDWLSRPPEAALDAANQQLEMLGAIERNSDGFVLTTLGRAMLGLGVEPRFARLLLSGKQRGIARSAALAVALLSEGEIREQYAQVNSDLEAGESDLQERIDVYRLAEQARFKEHTLRALNLRARQVREVRRAYEQLSRRVPGDQLDPLSESAEVELRRAVLSAFPDHVARRAGRDAQGFDRLILKNGTRARLSPRSVVHTAELLVALDLEERLPHTGSARSPGMARPVSSEAMVRWASAIDGDWLLDDHAEHVDTSDELIWNSERGRVEHISRLSYGSVVLDESRTNAEPGDRAGRVLFEAVKPRLAALFGQRDRVEQLIGRLRLLQQLGLLAAFDLDIAALAERACQTAVSLEQLENIDFTALLLAQLDHEAQTLLRDETPEAVTLRGGRRVSVHYEEGKPPWIASRLQDFFGSTETPRICRGKVALTLHLLAPNQRAVQVTSDLQGFWQRHYQDVRKELRRRYPKHDWPDDGATAEPPSPHPRRAKPR